MNEPQKDTGFMVEDRDRWEGGGTQVSVFRRIHPTCEAAFAMAMIERWGMVAGIPDGEDSAGRARLRKATPEELAKEACATAAATFAEFRERGWLLDLPDPAPSLARSPKGLRGDTEELEGAPATAE